MCRSEVWISDPARSVHRDNPLRHSAHGPQSPRFGARSASSPSFSTDMGVSWAAPQTYFPQPCEKNTSRQHFALPSVRFRRGASSAAEVRSPVLCQGCCGAGGNRREPAGAEPNLLTAAPAAPAANTSAPTPTTGGPDFCSPKVKRECFPELTFVLKAWV